MKKIVGALLAFMLFNTAVYSAVISEIPEGAFMQCGSAEYISLPETVESIGNDAFSECTGLKVINLAENTSKIGDRAFYGCSSLKRAVLFETVDEIGEDAFEGCDNLTIYCYRNSYAEKYALQEDIPIYYLDELKVYGDVTGDGEITATDALWILQYALDSDSFEIDFDTADVDDNEKITSTDALNVLQKSLNRDFQFAVEK